MNTTSSKKKLVFGISASAMIALVLLVGTTLAYLFSVTTEKRNVFVPGFVDCEVVESFDGTNKTSVQVLNTGNTDAYIRVNLIAYYQNADGGVIAKTASVPEFQLAEDWVLGSDGYYYYRNPIAPGAVTKEMLGSQIAVVKDADGNSMVVEVMAEAIQSNPIDAVVDSWASAAGVQGDDSLLVEVKIIADHASGSKVRVDSYHADVGNDQKIDYTPYTAYSFLTDSVTNVADTDNGIFINAANAPTATPNSVDVFVNLQKNIEVKKVVLHFTNTFNAINQTVGYVSTTEKGMEHRHLSVVNEDGSRKVITFPEGADGSFFMASLTLNENSSVYLTEIEVWGYQIDQNHALNAQYKGSANMTNVTVPAGNGAVSDTLEPMGDYHKGVLNDGTISTKVTNPDGYNKMEFSSTTVGDVSVIYKLESAQVINKIQAFVGTSNPAEGGEKLPDKITVYVGHGEDISQCTKLGDCVPSAMGAYQTTETLKNCIVEGKDTSGQYVIVVFSGIDVSYPSSDTNVNATVFGVNEIQIWSDVSVVSWE